MESLIVNRKLSIWLLFVLFVFAASFFFIDTAKARNNIYYAGFAVPVLIWTLMNWRSALQFRCDSLLLLLTFFAATALVEFGLMREEMFSVFKHGLYLLMLFIGAHLILQRPSFERYWVCGWGGFILLCLLIASGKWLWIYLSTGQLVRLELIAAASNPVHAALMISSGLSAFWLFVIEPRLQRLLPLLLGLALIVAIQVWVAVIFDARSALTGVLMFIAGWAFTRRDGLKVLMVVAVLLGGVLQLSGALDLFMARGVSYRLVIWQDALTRVFEHCGVAFGCGKDGYLFLGQFFHAHNSYLSVFYHYGLFVALLGALWAAHYWYWGVRVQSRWFLVSLIGWGGLLTTGSGVLSSPQPFWLYFWLPILFSMIEIRRLRSAGRSSEAKESHA
ncbi:MAG: hypothetical protein ACRERW_13905 [Pseudomonas sp.]